MLPAATGGRVLLSDKVPAWISEARLVDELVPAAMHRLDIPVTNTKPFDELVASGELKAAECRVMRKSMVDPDWLERATRNNRDKS